MFDESGLVQRLADRGHAAVHHVAGRDDIGARARVRHRGLRQPLERGIVLHFAIHNQSAMAVAGVFAIADVGHHQQLRDFALHRADGLLHDAVIGISARCDLVLGLGNAEQNHAADAELVRLFAFVHQLVHRKLRVPGHGADLAPHAFARTDEQRQDEIGRIEHASREPGCAAPRWRAGGACDESGNATDSAFLNGDRLQLVALLNLVDHVLAAGDLAENGVLAVQPIGDDVRDEKLAAVGVRAGVGHRERADLVLVRIALGLVFELVAGAAAAAGRWDRRLES